MADALGATQIIARLGLQPHPEGGHFRETWREPSTDAGRGSGTAIYFLLRAGEVSRWHRIDAVEIWHHYAGDALALSIAAPGADAATHLLGRDILGGEQPQAIVPKHAWQSARIPEARVAAGWSLVGCTVSPAFDFAGFELAPDAWEPSR